jgi:erythromycin esterase
MMKYHLICCMLVVTFVASGQKLTAEQLTYLEKNAIVVCENDAAEPVWNALSSQLKNKRIILLGEFTHGSKEIFSLRTSLIRHLHQTLGVNVILFESGIGELITADLNKQTMSGKQMTNGLFGGWRTKEFVELMEYVKAENLSVAGFDVQRTGSSFQFVLKDLATKKKIDSVHYYNLEQRYTAIARELTNRKAVYDSLQSKTQKLIDDYQTMQRLLEQHRQTDQSKTLTLSIVTLQNRQKYLSYMLAFLKDRNFNKRWASRDEAMAENVQWLLDNVYKNQRVIIIGHNFHIAKYNEKENVMGEILQTTYRKDMFALGVFAGGGSYHDNGSIEKQMLPPDSTALDIKHVIQSLKGTVHYLPLPKTPSAGSEWLQGNIIVNDTFINLNTDNVMNLSKSFDGLLLIKKSSPPKE